MGPELPLVIVVLVGLGYVFAAMRKGRVATMARTSRLRTLHVAAPPDAVFDALRQPLDRYRLDDADPGAQVLVLSVPPSFATWGFFFPVWIQPGPDGGSVVEIGIASKLVQVGPLVTRAHTRFVTAVESRLTRPPTARVVGG